MNDTTIQSKVEALVEGISGCKGVLVAFSGGVDSGLLAALIRDLPGGRVHALFIDSPLLPRSAREEAGRMAKLLGIPFEAISLPFPGEEVCRNQPDRCYHCRRSWAAILLERAGALGLSCVADGANCTDLSGHRPGFRAFTEAGILHPFIDAGMKKEEIRGAARDLGLPFWDKPPAACLATRIPYGEPITEEQLGRIGSAEDLLHKAGFPVIRVRCHGVLARIEVPGDDITRLSGMRDRIVSLVKGAGFTYVTLDLEGFRSGSMDEVLGSREREGS